MSVLGTLVVRIAAEMAKYKADLGEAANATEQAAGKIEGASGRAEGAAARMGGAMGQAAEAAAGLSGAAIGTLAALGGLAAGAAAVAFAHHQAGQEQLAYQKALVLTGNAAGTTIDQMRQMAVNVSAQVGAQHQAAQAIAAMAATGQVAVGNLQSAGETAIRVQRVLGASVAETAKVYAELRQDPVKASLKLNESMNYLTVATYQQIKAAQDLGDMEQAAAVAQDAYSAAQTERTKEVARSLGLVQNAWQAAQDVARSTWEVFLNIGREDTLEQKLDSVRASISRKLAMASQGGLLGKLWESGLEDARQEQANLQEAVRLRQKSADLQAQQAALTKAQIQWDQEGLQYATEEYKLKLAINKATEENNRLLAAGAITPKQAQDRLNEITARSPLTKTALDQRIAYYEQLQFITQSGEKRALDTITSLHAAQLVSDEEFINYKQGLALKANAESVKTVNDEIAAVKASGVPQQDKLEAIAKYNNELAKLKEKEKDIRSTYDNEIRNAEDKANREYIKSYADTVEAQQKKADSLREQLAAQQAANAEIGLSAVEVANLRNATIELNAAEKERFANLEQIASPEYAQALRDQAKLLRELGQGAIQGANKTAAVEAAKKAAEEWKRTAEKIESSITDALMRAFERGESIAEAMRDTIVNMFKTLVLRPVVEVVVHGGLGMLGLGGFAGAANAASAVGGTSDLAAGASMLSGMKNWLVDFGGSVSGVMTSLGGSVQELALITGKAGPAFGSLGRAISGSAASIGQFATYAGYAIAAFSAFDAASKGQWGKAVGTGIGAWFGGPIGSFIGGAVGGWVDDAFGGGHEYTTATGISGKFSNKDFAGRNYQDWRNDGSSGIFGIGASGSSSGTNYSAMDERFRKSLAKTYTGLQDQTAEFAKALGANTTTITGYSKDIKLALGSDAEANKKAIAEMFKGMADDMAATVLDAKYIRDGEGAADTLARLATNLTLVNGALDTLGDNLFTVGQASGDAASSLVDSFGGADKFQSAIGTYYQRFYTPDERLAKQKEQLQKQFADLGLAVPDTVEAYRNLVNAQDLSTEAGRKNYAALIRMSSVFADVTDAANAANVKLADVARSLEAMLQNIASARDGVASSRRQISPDPVLTPDEIRRRILDASSAANPDALRAAAANLADKTLVDNKANAAYQAAKDNALKTGQAYTGLVDENAAYVNKIKAAGTEIHALADSYVPGNGFGMRLSTVSSTYSSDLNNDAYRYDAKTNRVNGFADYGTRGVLFNLSAIGSGRTDLPVYRDLWNNQHFQELRGYLGGANDTLAQYEQRIATAKKASDAANGTLTTATTDKAAADAAAKKAAQEYAKAVSDWTAEASKSVPKLEKLRDETMRYYEAQQALAGAMSASAKGLRDAVANAREAQLDSEALARKRLGDYGQDYSMALATTGYTKAQYADKMTALLPQLAQSLQDQASTAAQAASMTGVLFAQADTIAKQLDEQAPHNYQEESLALLDTIDASLAALDDSTRAITRAIDASGNATVEGLRAVVKTLGGTPAFASGGYHSGGLRLVGENGPELEVTGPARIFSASQTAALFRGGSGADDSATAAEVRAMRADLRAAQIQTAAIMQRLLKIHDKWDGDGLPTTRSEAA